MKKWPGTDATTPSFENNYVIFRLSEVYLNAAEAGVKIGGASAVKGLNYLNAIVQRANPAKEVTAAEYTLDRVLEERSKELIGEGHRFFDMLRNGKTIVRKGGYHLPGINVFYRFQQTSLHLVLIWSRIRDILKINFK